MSDDAKHGDLATIEEVPYPEIRLMLPTMRMHWRTYWSTDAAAF